MERAHTLPDNRITLLKVGKHTVRRRPHYGCGDCPWVYDILDSRGHTVRSIVSYPSVDDCASAIRWGGEPTVPTIDEIIAKVRERDDQLRRNPHGAPSKVAGTPRKPRARATA
jgi:hypothetical protein